MKNIIIFGAQAIALGTYRVIKKIYSERDILCFLVSKRGINASKLGGIVVEEIDSFSASLSSSEKEAAEVWIATPEPVMPEIEVLLEEHGFCNHKRVTSRVFAELMEAYFADSERVVSLYSLPVSVLQERVDEVPENACDAVQVFMAKFYRDK